MAGAGRARYTGWTRDDWVGLLARLTDGFVRSVPLRGSPAAARLPNAAPDDSLPRIEGFARMSLAWAAWLHEPSNPRFLDHGERRHDVASLLARGLCDATDPDHAAWWGPIGDRDQRIVEAAEIATAIWLGGNRLRAAIDEIDRRAMDRILDWLAQVDGREVWPDNWVLFPMITAVVRRWAGREIGDEPIDAAIDSMSACHVGDGWYSDGPGRALDLYTGWAIHWHLLWWATIDGSRRPERRTEAIRQARAWLSGVAPLFAADGSFPVFGRSLAYRFAVVAPFVQAALLGVDPLVPGLARRLASGSIRNALERGAVDPLTDWFRVGVAGERPEVVEPYVSTGSVAWAAHAFVALAMPPTHPFWSVPEAALPADSGESGEIAAGAAGLLGMWDGRTGETRVYNARSGHPADVPDHDYAARYGKLVYHSAFAFDMPVGRGASPGTDNSLVAVEPAAAVLRWGHRNETIDGAAGPTWIRARYDLPIQSGSVHVTTVVIVLGDGQGDVRVHAVEPPAPVRIREGGASLGVDDGLKVEEVRHDERGDLVALTDGRRTVAVRRLFGYDAVGRGDASGGSVNLVHACSSHPYVEESLATGDRRLLAAATLATAARVDARDVLSRLTLDVAGDEVRIASPSAFAVVSFAEQAPRALLVAERTFRGPALRVARASADGTSFAGETVRTVEGVVRLDSPGPFSIRKVDGTVVATVGAGFRVEPAWSGDGLSNLSVRSAGVRFEPAARLAEPGVVPPALVRRLARAAGTRLVTIRLQTGP